MAIKDATVTEEYLKGHSVLTQDQCSNLIKRMRPPRIDYCKKTYDEGLLRAFHEILTLNGPVDARLEEGLSAGMADPALTKNACSWDAVIANCSKYEDIHSYNFGYLKSYRVARKILQTLVGSPCLKPIPIYRGMDMSTVWNNPDASAAAIGRGSKKDNEVECLDAFHNIKDGVRRGVKFSDLQIPALPGHRTQVGGFYNKNVFDDYHYYQELLKLKDRLVWMIDGGTTTFEAQYAIPIQKHLSINCSWYSGGKSPSEMRRTLRIMRQYPFKWVSIDYSSFDATVPARVIHDIFVDIIRPAFPEECLDELRFIEYNFIHTKLLLPGNVMFVKHQGIPSGSMFTQIIGSLADLLVGLTYFCSKYRGSEEEIFAKFFDDFCDQKDVLIAVMGDDNIWGSRQIVFDLDDIAGYVSKVFGMKIHPDKCDSSAKCSYPKYLKREWTERGERMNLLYLILNTCHPEKGTRSYDGYTPYHILYGLVYTYSGSFRNAGLVMEYLVEKMQNDGGLEALITLNTRELPGIFRGYSDKARMLMYLDAKATARRIA